MGAFGIGRGICKIVKGIATGDGEEIVLGIKKTAINTLSTIAFNEGHERLINDDDDD